MFLKAHTLNYRRFFPQHFSYPFPASHPRYAYPSPLPEGGFPAFESSAFTI